MLLGMTGLGEIRTPNPTRLVMGLSHTVGGLLGGAGTVAAAWVTLIPARIVIQGPALKICLTLVLALAVLVDLGLLQWRDRRGQANPEWRVRFGHIRSYFLYGFLFGSGWLTLKPSATYYAVIAVAAGYLPLGHAVLAGALFGIGRTILVYPASYRATAVSLVIARGRHSYRLMRAAGVTVTLSMLATLWWGA